MTNYFNYFTSRKAKIKVIKDAFKKKIAQKVILENISPRSKKNLQMYRLDRNFQAFGVIQNLFPES